MPKATVAATGLLAVGLAVAGCATPQAPADESAAEKSPDPIVLTDEGKHYLESVYRAECASEYLFHPEGEGPPVPDRTDAEWREREEELTTCLREKVAGRYTRLATVHAMMWNGEGYSMSDAAMQGIVRFGDAFLEEHVKGLLDAERRRAGRSGERS